ncbi:MAG: DNA polymerase I [Candidatus Aegiribacteria sp.]|nr:DNA polymerase I [Candidatus Aegiribacteria sp.]
MAKRKYLLIDCNALLYRGHFAMMSSPLRAKDGTNTSGIFHLVRQIIDLKESRLPDITVAVFDHPSPVFRVKIYPEYKANRPPMPDELRSQSEYARKLIPALGFPLLEKEGFEADDIIAWLTQEAVSRGDKVEILSSDKDFLQLAADGVTIIRPGRRDGQETLVGKNDVESVMGVRADQVADFLALTGDSSDNIPGAKGIGPKTALKLIKKFQSIDGIYESVADVSPDSVRIKLENSMQMVLLSRKLISLQPAHQMDISLEDLSMKLPDAELASDILTSLGMQSILDRLGMTPAGDLFSSLRNMSSTEWCSTAVIGSIHELEGLDLSRPGDGFLALDTETTSKRPFQAVPVGISLTTSEDSAVYIPLSGTDALSIDEVVPVLNRILEDRLVVAQNGKYDIHILESMGLRIKELKGDPMIADYLLRPELQSHSLSNLSSTWLKRSMMEYGEILGNAESLADVETIKVAEYCGCDSAAALKLSRILRKELEKDDRLLNLYDTLELPLVRVISDMEKRGIGLDIKSLKKLETEFTNTISELVEEARETAGFPINLNSPAQVSHALFDILGLTPIKKTSKGVFSSSMEVLEKLRGKHRFVETVIEHRELSKLLNTYIKKMPGYICERDGMIHTSFSQTVTATGRLSSSSPNLQNIPVRTSRGREVRRCFISPREGHVLITADYSQIELRILAHFAGPGNLRRAYEENMDIHSKTAEALFGDASPAHRRKAKEVNFSILYGISSWGLSNRLNISRGEAAGIISRYLETYPELESFFSRCIVFAEEHEETRTILGRRREFKGFKSARGTVRSSMERMVINTTVQGSAADIIKIAMLKVDRRLREVADSGLVLQVHDELVATAPECYAEKVSGIIREEMESAFELDVPLVVETGSGNNWLEAEH